MVPELPTGLDPRDLAFPISASLRHFVDEPMGVELLLTFVRRVTGRYVQARTQVAKLKEMLATHRTNSKALNEHIAVWKKNRDSHVLHLEGQINRLNSQSTQAHQARIGDLEVEVADLTSKVQDQTDRTMTIQNQLND